MEVYCRYSGLSFKVENFTHKMRVEGIHPIFFVPTERLLNRAHDWADRRLDPQETRLLFLALLHSSDLVDFQVPARCAVATAEMHMEKLMNFLRWHSDKMAPALTLPSFVISNDTASLTNVGFWLEAWTDCRNDWENRRSYNRLRDILSKKEQALQKLIKSPIKSEDYAGKLADWAIAATSQPAHIQEYWKSLFKLKGIAVYTARTADLQELLDEMEEKLQDYVGSIYPAAVLRHLRLLLAKNLKGLEYALGMSDEFLATQDFIADEENPYKILSIEDTNKAAIAASAPLTQPKESDYPSKVAYLRAKAAYGIATAQQTALQAQAAKETRDMQLDELDSSHLLDDLDNDDAKIAAMVDLKRTADEDKEELI